jgi:integrase
MRPPRRSARPAGNFPLLLGRDATAAGLRHPISLHRLRHFLLTWLKPQGIRDALIQPYSGHASRQSVRISSRLTIGEAQVAYDEEIRRFPMLPARPVTRPCSSRAGSQTKIRRDWALL